MVVVVGVLYFVGADADVDVDVDVLCLERLNWSEQVKCLLYGFLHFTVLSPRASLHGEARKEHRQQHTHTYMPHHTQQYFNNVMVCQFVFVAIRHIDVMRLYFFLSLFTAGLRVLYFTRCFHYIFFCETTKHSLLLTQKMKKKERYTTWEGESQTPRFGVPGPM